MDRAIYFDLDATLVHFTEPYDDVLESVVEDVAGTVEQAWLDTMDETFLERRADGHSSAYRDAAAAVDAFSERDVEDLLDRLLAAEIEASEPAPGVQSTLDTLSEDYALGVLTNGVGHWQRAKLEAFDLAGYVEVCIGCDDAGALKPDPAPFELAERRLPAAEYALVGDSDADVDGAERAGWAFHRYEGGEFPHLPTAFGWET